MKTVKVEEEIEFPCARRNIPEFLLKLYSILENDHYQQIISWDPSGSNILIYNRVALEDEVLSHFYNQRKFSSFVRQLNMYNFHKNMELNPNATYISFRNLHFRRGFPSELLMIKRKDRRARKRTKPQVKSEPNIGTFQLPDYQQFVRDNVRLIETELVDVCRRHPILAPELSQTFKLTNLLLGRSQYYPTLGDFGDNISSETLLRSKNQLIYKTEYTLSKLETRCNLDALIE